MKFLKILKKKKFNTRENNVSTHETLLPAGDKDSE